jgi:hypothetical protein
MRNTIQLLTISLVLICAPPLIFAAEFVGSTPCGALPREFLGGLATNADCHNITWHITLSTNQDVGRTGTFSLTAQYYVPTRANTNRSEPGPKAQPRGTCEVLKGTRADAIAVVYRITTKDSQRSLSLVRVGDNLLHFLNSDGSLMVGNGGWSYTLNRAERSEKIVDPSVAATVPDMSYKIVPLATGPTVFAVYEGRSPCHGIARELKLPQHAGCHKVKWRVTLYQNPDTSAPTTYKIEGTLFRREPREGTWSITRSASTDPNATVYQLNAKGEPPLLLLKANENILFFLDQNRAPLVGNADFSYTLNRVIRN